MNNGHNRVVLGYDTVEWQVLERKKDSEHELKTLNYQQNRWQSLSTENGDYSKSKWVNILSNTFVL